MSPRLSIFLLPLALAVSGQAQIVLDSVRFGYTGTVTRYASLADAQSGTNALAFAVPQRDLGIYVVKDAPWYYPDCNYIGTTWNFVSTADGRTPSNTNLGFVQLGDLNASTVNALSSSWNAELDTFTLHLSGTNATHADDYARLWNAGGAAGSWPITYGSFLSYDLALVASGLSASWDSTHNTYSASNTEPATVSGRFTGLFQNTSSDDGFAYTFDLSLNMTSWVYAHRNSLTTENNAELYTSSSFASPTLIPEPATTVVFLGLATLCFAFWRRRVRRR